MIDARYQRVRSKPGLRAFYQRAYRQYQDCLDRCPPYGQAVELGSGYGFLKEVLPDVLTSDVMAFSAVDRIEDARRLSFADGTLRALFLLNTFHHISDPERFFREAVRCLVPGGRILIIDPYPGFISSPVNRWLHDEHWDPAAPTWRFTSHDPYHDANGALAWIVFERDRPRFEALFPSLHIASKRHDGPLLYWLSGGLKSWTLVPRWMVPIVSAFDQQLLRLSPHWGSFAVIELVKQSPSYLDGY